MTATNDATWDSFFGGQEECVDRLRQQSLAFAEFARRYGRDGRPDDEDGYRGEDGIEDTRRAVLDARSQGIHPFCITIDDEVQAYVPHMFGPAGYAVVDNVAKLPCRVSDVHRRITA
jgi:hypothetical protein